MLMELKLRSTPELLLEGCRPWVQVCLLCPGAWCVNHLASEDRQAPGPPAHACQANTTEQQEKHVAKSLAPFSFASEVFG